MRHRRGSARGVERSSAAGGRLRSGERVADEMWPLARTLLDGAIVVPVRAVADAVRLLVERAHVVAEGAGAAAVAAALSGPVPNDPIVCIVSGGNIDLVKLAAILRGELP